MKDHDPTRDDPPPPVTASSRRGGPCPPAEFADRVVRLARARFPLIDCRRVDELQIQFGSSNVNLFNFYRSFVGNPEAFEQIVLPALTTVVQMQELGPDHTSPPLERVRDRVMPMLYPQASWESGFPNFAGLEWVAGLAVLYVVDEAHSYWYIRDELLQRWGIGVDELHQFALENLEAYFQKRTMQLAGHPRAPTEGASLGPAEEVGPRLLMPHSPDAYNTTRLVSSGFQAKVRELLGGDFAVGVPSRDFFVAFSLDSTETTETIRHKVAEDFSSMDHPLSDRLLFVTADGVSEYCADWMD